jgi:hypothetical protein
MLLVICDIQTGQIKYTNVAVKNIINLFLYTIKYYIFRAKCFDPHCIILRPSKKTDPRTTYVSMHCGMLTKYIIKM